MRQQCLLSSMTFATVAAVVLASCAAPPTLSRVSLQGGKAIADLLSAADTVVLLLYDPADCLACGAPIGVWRTWEAASQRRKLVLVLTRPPTRREAEALFTARVAPAAILASGRSPMPVPSAYVVVSGAISDSGVGRGGIGAVMARVTHRP